MNTHVQPRQAIGHQMTEVELYFTEEDVLQAFGDRKSSSATGSDGVSAAFIKNCALALAIPLTSVKVWLRVSGPCIL